MATMGSWDDIFNEAEEKLFIGRERELAIFRQQVNLDKPDFLIFYITGQGGVGKTTLLNRYRDIAKDESYLLVDCDEQQKGITAILGRFSHQLAEQKFPLKRFEERYRVFLQKMSEIESDPEAPQGLAALIGRTVVRAAFVGGDLIPGVRRGLEHLPQDSLETQAGEWTSYLFKKLSNNKDDIALIREPVPILTSLFFEDLNEISKTHRILLCFENFEETRHELQDWMRRLREYKISPNIRLAIAGRDLPGANWEALYKVTRNIRLDRFDEQEAEMFLDVYGVADYEKRKEILDFSGRLPVLMNWLVILGDSDPDPSVPTHDIVERFLRWVKDPSLRYIALLAAFPREFNIDILTPLLANNQAMGVQSAFTWLQTMPFVSQHTNGWRYHDVVRRMLLQHQRQESPQGYRQMHRNLADFYDHRRLKLELSESERWLNEQWREDTLAYVYHFLMANPVRHWSIVVSLFVVAIHKHRLFAKDLVNLLFLEDINNELSQNQNGLIQLFRQKLESIRNGNLKEGLAMFHKLCDMPDLTPQAKGYAFAYCGMCYLESENYEKAIDSFVKALDYTPEDMWIIVRRGIGYRDKGDFPKAIADFDQAISFEGASEWIVINRGLAYHAMERYEDALLDFGKIIALDEKNAHAFSRRGETHRQMGQYEKALADFTQIIALDEKNAWTFSRRGETHRQMGQYEKALADFTQVIALGNRNYTSRGLVLSYLGRYNEALNDYKSELEGNHDSFVSFYNIAVVMARWKGLPDAQEYIDNARQALLVALDTDRGSALYGLAGLEALEKNVDQALDYLQQALLLKNQAIYWARHDIAWADVRFSNEIFRSLIF